MGWISSSPFCLRGKLPVLDLPDVEHPSLYPSFPTVQEALVHLESQLPITTYNELIAALMVFRNASVEEQSAQE